ncbi:hypothetical protein VNO78_32136 [Psophocarpus tetragonolobus]|uniref:O-methyltransferase C-terminal domain-containing protein n=1 Tax=Psophocarpus tetragonolobus TaxID=3891 RepID=A0AAN9RZ11_PSOTE
MIQEAPPYSVVEHIGGDMFVSVPKGDVIFMKNRYDSLPGTGKVILAEGIIPETPNSNLASKCVFQIMLCHSPSGKERTEKEYKALAEGAGFHGFLTACCVINTCYGILKKARVLFCSSASCILVLTLTFETNL